MTPPLWVVMLVSAAVSVALTSLLPKNTDLGARVLISFCVGFGVGSLITRLYGS